MVVAHRSWLHCNLSLILCQFQQRNYIVYIVLILQHLPPLKAGLKCFVYTNTCKNAQARRHEICLYSMEKTTNHQPYKHMLHHKELCPIWAPISWCSILSCGERHFSHFTINCPKTKVESLKAWWPCDIASRFYLFIFLDLLL